MPVETISPSDPVSTGPAKLNNNFDYLVPIGTTVPVTLGPSPATYTAGDNFEIAYLSGGSITSVTRNGVPITTGFPITVILWPGVSMVVTYDSIPSLVIDK
jgi:hypothetical protein